MSNLEKNDPELVQVRRDLIRALSEQDVFVGGSESLGFAIEALIDIKIAIAVEMLADRVQDAAGVRP